MSVTGVIEDDVASNETPNRKRQAFTFDFQDIRLNMSTHVKHFNQNAQLNTELIKSTIQIGGDLRDKRNYHIT